MRRKLFVLFAILISSSSITFAKSYEFKTSVEAYGGIISTDYSYNRTSLGASLIGGFQVKPKFFAGLLLGYQNMYVMDRHMFYMNGPDEDFFASKNLIRIGVRAKANFNKKNVSPFFLFDFGGTAHLNTKESTSASGFFVAPSLGLDFKLNDNYSIYVALGYDAQTNRELYDADNEYKVHYYFDAFEDTFIAQFIDLRIGFNF